MGETKEGFKIEVVSKMSSNLTIGRIPQGEGIAYTRAGSNRKSNVAKCGSVGRGRDAIIKAGKTWISHIT